MRILVYGEGYFYALAPQLKASLLRLGCDVDIFDWTDSLFQAGGRSIWNRLFDRSLGWFVDREINKRLCALCSDEAYDLLIVVTGWHLTADTLNLLRSRVPCICNWSMEELFNYTFRRLSNYDSYALYDVVFSPRRHMHQTYRDKGINRVEYLPFFYYPEHQPVQLTSCEQGYWGSDIAFMGSWSRSREKFLLELAGNYQIKVWGAGWERSTLEFRSKHIVMNTIAWLSDMARVAAGTKIIIDVLTKEQSDFVNMKNYQVPACAGFLLSEDNLGFREIFPDSATMPSYIGRDDLLEKCEYYLHADVHRNEIKEKSYDSMVSNKNCIDDRVKRILLVCQDYAR